MAAKKMVAVAFILVQAFVQEAIIVSWICEWFEFVHFIFGNVLAKRMKIKFHCEKYGWETRVHTSV